MWWAIHQQTPPLPRAGGTPYAFLQQRPVLLEYLNKRILQEKQLIS